MLTCLTAPNMTGFLGSKSMQVQMAARVQTICRGLGVVRHSYPVTWTLINQYGMFWMQAELHHCNHLLQCGNSRQTLRKVAIASISFCESRINQLQRHTICRMSWETLNQASNIMTIISEVDIHKSFKIVDRGLDKKNWNLSSTLRCSRENLSRAWE